MKLKYKFVLTAVDGTVFSFSNKSLIAAIEGFETLMCSNIPDLTSILEFWTALDAVVEMLIDNRKNADGKFAVHEFDLSDPEDAFTLELELIGPNYCNPARH